MPDRADQPPRVRVHLPGGAPAHLLRWRQDEAGRWWAEVTLHVPADAVQQLVGEDYAAVPREAATPPEPGHGFVLQVLPGGHRELHVAGCWAATRGLTPCPTPDARAHLAAGVEACDACNPAP